jgi:DNA-3-methyladenine glycosylase
MHAEQNARKTLAPDFYTREDVVDVARDLLGKALCSNVDNVITKAVITETEAYAGVEDRASHAYGGRRTARTEPMFAEGGIAYVYLCYGIHHLFNVVTGRRDNPLAVLVRAGLPLTGVDEMLTRRGRDQADKQLLAGPGSLSRALGIRTELSGTSLAGGSIWIEDHGIEIADAAIAVGPRIGVDYAAEDAALPYRFVVAEKELGESLA